MIIIKFCKIRVNRKRKFASEWTSIIWNRKLILLNLNVETLNICSLKLFTYKTILSIINSRWRRSGK